MKRSEELLREACARIAEDEADALARRITPSLEREAEDLYRRHRRQVFRLIEKSSRKRTRPAIWLRGAACFALLIGVAILALHQRPVDHTPLSPGTSASVAPYTSAPAATATSLPEITPMPTATPEPTPWIMEAPETIVETTLPQTGDINGEPEPVIEVTPLPTPTPQPVVTPTAIPAITPTLLPMPTSGQGEAKDLWPGQFFPEGILIRTEAVGQAADHMTYTYETGSGPVTFTEYSVAAMLSPVPGASAAYVQLGGTIALLETVGDQATLTWVADGRTLSVTAPAAEAEQIALSVKKLREQ